MQTCPQHRSHMLHGELFVIAISFAKDKPDKSASTVTRSWTEHLPQTRHPTSCLLLMHSCSPRSSKNLPLVTTLSSCFCKQLTQPHHCPLPALCALVQHQLFLSYSCQHFQLRPCQPPQGNAIQIPPAFFFQVALPGGFPAHQLLLNK